MTHARLYIASTYQLVPELESLLHQSTDVEHFVAENFTIADARMLYSRATLRPVEDSLRQFIVSFGSITSEAQNALLKLFEEPPVTSVFHIVVAREDMLLSTVRSRLQLVSTVHRDHVVSDVFKDFQQSTLNERLAAVTTRTKNKDQAWAEAIVLGAEQVIQADITKKGTELLETVVYIRRYLGKRGASTKLLLEELALSLPPAQA